jgi:hypothetical protein
MKLLTLALFFSCLFTPTHSTSMRYLQTITVTFPGELPIVLVDNQRIKCHCGKQPVQVHVLNGIVFANCADHRISIQ